ncbi:CDP-glycerol:glycerophosphate glycerophosphotransferase [Micromonospora sp. WMMD1102]|uniref:bifunctional glycosyltransferase/CDP-glycerol:glycerophosphate glycerophosphotransferase n=1 Tax=Micromonospora sp. WMMD1102 TaxID=3016105 RepID=UPI0024157253|nr:CDP-glycerol:glycerophosphate glycerophosphotransferase [Micromonospora sp. WMMD1102]MDG4790307.1 CDP-glycerol:glycerophosphate glycerophosphotransferase [Micromonospora sp. WMMD1102]
MTLVSFVVPVYRVQGYLRECLDSILGQPVEDIEVVVVDDCSPDSCGEIIAEYAARDDRVRAVTLGRNVGLGEARNTGLDQATGEYVWFLDSDDWLVDGCLPAVAERLRRVGPEVLLVDHVRAYWDHRVRGGDLARTVPDSGDGVCTVRDRPELLEVLHTAWNKVVRRRFLRDAGLRFGPGWYEDVSFSYPVLLAAGRISVLDEVCVNYRQRRCGAITRTRDDRHFEVFPHWHRVFDLMDRWGPEHDDLRPLVFERMLWHYLIVLGNGRRLSPELRRDFFAQVVADYRRWLPPGGYRVPGGIDGVKHRLVAGDHWWAYALLRAVHHARGDARRLVRRARRSTPPSGVNRLPGPAYLARLPGPLSRVAGLAREGLLRGYYRVQLRRRLDPTLAVYAAYWYRGHACNPAAIYQRASELAPRVRGVWVVRRDRVAGLPPGLPYVVAGSRPYFRVLARAKWLVNNVNFPDYVVKRPGSVHVQTHHGTPVKVMGLDQQDYPRGAAGLDFPGLLRRIDRWDYSVSANTFSSQMWERAYPAEYRTLEVGYPRNDRLVNAGPAEVGAVRRALGIDPGERVVLYAPTHREHRPGYSPPFDPAALLDVLGPAGRVLVRGHYLDPAAPTVPGVVDGRDRVLEVTGHGCVEDLYLAADVLVTDYSSAMFDYATLDRPIVVYAPDWAEYRRERGVYLDVLAEAPGVAVRDFAGLLAAFRTGVVDGPPAALARSRFRERFCALDDGRAAERVVRRVLLGEPD